MRFETLNGLVADLELLARAFAEFPVPDSEKEKAFKYSAQIGETKFSLRIEQSVEGAEAKIKQLKSSNSSLSRWRNRNLAKPHKVPSKQAPYSKALAQRFIEDGELDNLENYKALYAQ
jgi:hypothetical protein